MEKDYDASTRAYRRYKGLVTRRHNRRDWQGVIDACNAAFTAFDAAGVWPDDWARFERAKSDAHWQLELADRRILV